MHFKAPAPKRKHTLWQRNKSYPASVGFVGSVCALQRTRAKTRSQPVAAQHKRGVLCCALRGCARIRQQILKIRCERAESRCVVLCPDMFQCLLALCEAYSRFGRLAGNCNCQRAARAQLRGNQTQPLAQWRLAARARPQNGRCPRLFGPLQSCLHAVWTQLRPVACHKQRLDVSAVVWQRHQVD